MKAICQIVTVGVLFAVSAPVQADVIFSETFAGIADDTNVATLSNWGLRNWEVQNGVESTIQDEELNVVHGSQPYRLLPAMNADVDLYTFTFDVVRSPSAQGSSIWGGLIRDGSGDTRVALVERGSSGDWWARIWDNGTAVYSASIGVSDNTGAATISLNPGDMKVKVDFGSGSSGWQSIPNTSLAGISSLRFSAQDDYARFDKVTMSSIPEPSALALLGVGLTSLLCYAWRRRK